MVAKIYGIKNCDTMKKALKWMDEHGASYDFHDYKKQGVDENVLAQAIEAHGWKTVLNRRGTTWRALDKGVQEKMDDDAALKTAVENPSIIKRPLLLYDGKTYLGFDQEIYAELFSK